jgi:hypothetical protein
MGRMMRLCTTTLLAAVPPALATTKVIRPAFLLAHLLRCFADPRANSLPLAPSRALSDPSAFLLRLRVA